MSNDYRPMKDSPFTKSLRSNAVCIDMYRAADVIDAYANTTKQDEALMKRALRGLEIYIDQTRPIVGMAEIIDDLRRRLNIAGDAQ